MNETEYEMYANPAMRDVRGPARTRPSALTEVVPVRLRKEDLDEIRQICKATDRSVSEFVRDAISAALDPAPHPKTGDPTPVDELLPSDAVRVETLADQSTWGVIASTGLMAAQPPVEFRPRDVLARHVLDVSSQLLADVASVVVRFEDDSAFDEPERLFSARVDVDDDSFYRRPRQHWSVLHGFANREMRELALLQSGLSAVLQLATEPAPTGAEIALLREQSAQLKQKVRDLLARARSVQPSELSESAWSGYDAFLSASELVRRVLGRVDDDLFQLERSYAET